MQSQKRKRSPSGEMKKDPKESKKKKTPDTSSTDLDSTLSKSARGLRANSKKKRPLEELGKNKTASAVNNKVEHWLNATNGQTSNTTLNFNEKESVANLLRKPCLSTFNINNQSHDLNSLLTLEGSSATSSKAISSAELELKSGNNNNNKKIVNKPVESTKLDSKLL